MIFATHSMSEHRLGSPEHRNVESVIDKTSSQGFQKTIKTNPQNALKAISIKNRFLQYFPCQNLVWEAPKIEISNQ